MNVKLSHENRHLYGRGQYRHIMSDTEYRALKESVTACQVCGLQGVKLCTVTNKAKTKILGFACNNCHLGFAQLSSDANLLLKAAEYLERQRG